MGLEMGCKLTWKSILGSEREIVGGNGMICGQFDRFEVWRVGL